MLELQYSARRRGKLLTPGCYGRIYTLEVAAQNNSTELRRPASTRVYLRFQP
jgi:hypothetical protein